MHGFGVIPLPIISLTPLLENTGDLAKQNMRPSLGNQIHSPISSVP